jgi:hypothetical protein
MDRVTAMFHRSQNTPVADILAMVWRRLSGTGRHLPLQSGKPGRNGVMDGNGQEICR